MTFMLVIWLVVKLEHTLETLFDLCETVDGFFLEGECPSIGNRDTVSIKRLGIRGLIIEAHPTFDIDQD